MIPNDRLLSISDRSVSVLDAFKQADQVLLQGVSGITDLITTPGLINLDFADVKSVMSNAGSALWASAPHAARTAQSRQPRWRSPARCSRHPIDGAHGVLLSIAGGSDLGLFEINEAAALVSQAAHAEANIIFGAVIDDALGDEVRVTVIAAGFDGGAPKQRGAGTVLRVVSRSRRSQPGRGEGGDRGHEPAGAAGRSSAGAPSRAGPAATGAARTSSGAVRGRRPRRTRLLEVGAGCSAIRDTRGAVEVAFTDRHGGVCGGTATRR